MRPITLIAGGIFLSVTLSTNVSAEDIHGHLSITRTLTKQRVQLPIYESRGVPVSAHKHTDGSGPSVNEWDRVAIYLEGTNPPPAAPVNSTIKQSGQRFEPEMIVIPAGSTVSFPNSDPIFHNVFSL